MQTLAEVWAVRPRATRSGTWDAAGGRASARPGCRSRPLRSPRTSPSSFMQAPTGTGSSPASLPPAILLGASLVVAARTTHRRPPPSSSPSCGDRGSRRDRRLGLLHDSRQCPTDEGHIGGRLRTPGPKSARQKRKRQFAGCPVVRALAAARRGRTRPARPRRAPPTSATEAVAKDPAEAGWRSGSTSL